MAALEEEEEQTTTQEEECVICMSPLCTPGQEDLSEDGLRRTLDCSHTFHESCIAQWLRQSPQCPVCRHRVGGAAGADALEMEAASAVLMRHVESNRSFLKRSACRQGLTTFVAFCSVCLYMAFSTTNHTSRGYALFPHLFLSFMTLSTTISLSNTSAVDIEPLIRFYNVVLLSPALRSVFILAFMMLELTTPSTSAVLVVLFALVSVFFSLNEDHRLLILLARILINTRNELRVVGASAEAALRPPQSASTGSGAAVASESGGEAELSSNSVVDSAAAVV